MFKKYFTTQVDTDDVMLDNMLGRVSKYSTNPKFFNDGVGRFEHYTNPVAYKLKGKYHIVNHYGSMEAILDQKHDKVILDIIDIEKKDVIEYLLTFQYQNYKQVRCLAEMVKVTLEYIATPEGKKWIKSISNSDNKEEQFSILFGITRHAAKCYLKLVQPGNEKYLQRLADDKDYRLSTAYAECNAEGESQSDDCSPQKEPVKQSNRNASSSAGKDRTSPNSNTGSGRHDDSVEKKPSDQPAPNPVSTNENFSNEAEFFDHLAQYKKDGTADPETSDAEDLAQKVVIILNDESLLELSGKIHLTVDGRLVSSMEQLHKLPNGNWSLPPQHNGFALTVYSDFFADF